MSNYRMWLILLNIVGLALCSSIAWAQFGAPMMMPGKTGAAAGIFPVSITFAVTPVSVPDSTGASVMVTGFTVNMPDGSVYKRTPTGACAAQSPCPFSIGGSTGAWVVQTATALDSSYDISGASYTVTAN